MWQIANHFRQWVCRELRNLNKDELHALKGDYLFVIDNQPRFIVMVDKIGAWSISFFENSVVQYEIDDGCQMKVTLEQIQNVLDGQARTRVLTDSKTLQKLLLGSLKAHIAFVTGRVSILGDLTSFLKMVSLLKKQGVKPIAENV